jgi:hypothetical protein
MEKIFMPLEKSNSKAAFQTNLKKELAAGKSEEQALAIAYSTQEAATKDSGSAREIDTNGWITVYDNPLSKVGVFPYSGATVGGDPSKIYQVYRPEEELSNPITIKSFTNIPWVDDHPGVLLGNSDEGLTPAEKKGIQGIIGEQVYFKDGILYGNIKIFSETLANLINSGKKQLSVGYQCMYEIVSGVWNGIPYDAIQRQILGNHLALVQEGRMGKQVAVLDSHYTFDSIEIIKELKMAEENKKEEEKKEGMDARFAKALDWIENKMAKDAAEEKEKEEKESAKDGMIDLIKGVDSEEKEEKEEKKDGMDAAAIEAAMDAKMKSYAMDMAEAKSYAERTSKEIGTFDHSSMTPSEIKSYCVKRLGLKAAAGNESIALDSYFHNRSTDKKLFGLDAANKIGGKLDAIIKKYK